MYPGLRKVQVPIARPLPVVNEEKVQWLVLSKALSSAEKLRKSSQMVVRYAGAENCTLCNWKGSGTVVPTVSAAIAIMSLFAEGAIQNAKQYQQC